MKRNITSPLEVTFELNDPSILEDLKRTLKLIRGVGSISVSTISKEKKHKYDYLIVGSGLYGAMAAYCLHKQGKQCLVIEKRPHIGGNLYCENIEGINVHKYGAHIFHTNSKQVWDFVNTIVEFNRFTNAPLANYKGNLYNLPFNMNTFCQIWHDVKTPEDVEKKIAEEKSKKDAVLGKYAGGNKVIRQLVDLALLQNNMLKGEALNNFIKRSIELI